MEEAITTSGAHDGSVVDTRLTMQTIADQQGIIKTLGEIITTLKTRIANLEGALAAKEGQSKNAAGEPAPLQESDAEAKRMLMEKVESLTSEVQSLRVERDELNQKCCQLVEAVEHYKMELQEAHARCVKLQWADRNYRAARSAFCLADARHRETEQRFRHLEKKVDISLPERSRWKALAMSLANQLDGPSRRRAMQRIIVISNRENSEAVTEPGAMQIGDISAVDGCCKNMGSSDMLNIPELEAFEMFDVFDGMKRTSTSPQTRLSPRCTTVNQIASLSFDQLPKRRERGNVKIAAWQKSVECKSVNDGPPDMLIPLMGNSRAVSGKSKKRFLAPL
uniref:WGS project CAEQ00000000 data, annotated contig 1319 n=1 Tax=Trypanosoma congolense (strain IL3000) TaxID=1068625 RepID=F9W5E7_TRYCI|nr:unnamed protein product [Trypanosoma congolense IL3000]